jgi:excinuclease ABC subunit C
MNSQQVISNHLSKEDKYTFAFKELAKDLGLSADINRIETFDVSHFSGDSAIASCVVFSKTGPYKKGIDFLIYQKNFLVMILAH